MSKEMQPCGAAQVTITAMTAVMTSSTILVH